MREKGELSYILKRIAVVALMYCMSKVSYKAEMNVWPILHRLYRGLFVIYWILNKRDEIGAANILCIPDVGRGLESCQFACYFISSVIDVAACCIAL